MEVYSIFTVDGLIKSSNRVLNEGIKAYKIAFIPFFFAFFVLLSVISCKAKVNNTHRIDFREQAIYSKENYSELNIDSTQLQAFLKGNQASDSIQNQVIQFYSWRGFQNAWLNTNGLSLAATNFHEQLQSDSQIFDDKSLENKTLDSLFRMASADEKQFVKLPKNVETLEMLLTITFFKYAEKVYGGATTSTRNLDWFIPRRKKNYLTLLDSLVSKNTNNMVQEPVNECYTRLKEKLILYRNIQSSGGFGPIIIDKKTLKLGDSASYVPTIKKHLFQTGDLASQDISPIFTTDLEVAIHNFQHRMGLDETGKIDPPTLKELNETVDFRIKQIMVNLERLRWVPVNMEKNYLLVNIPEFRLHVFENNEQIWQTNVVVGKAARRTSIFRGNLNTVVLNPYWGIPPRIAREEIAPKVKRNPNYLSNNNMEVVDGNYRQKPGVNNALGKMKFLFPNNYSIYLHDTPSKSLFEENARAFSHGCIRVSDPKRLAFHLLKNSEWTQNKINAILESNTNTNLTVKPSVPVYIAYFTAWVDNKGQMNFRKDIYDLDNKLSSEVFGQ
jgi:L,D-transpeptidase YcbB